MRMKLISSFAALLVFSLPCLVNAAVITGGVTDVRLDAPVADAVIGAGVTPAPTGSGTFDAGTLTFGFPITGGDLSDTVIPGSTIEHNGSGISFSAGATELLIGNFLIDTTALSITGSVMSVNPASGGPLAIAGGVPLFDLSTPSDVAGFPFVVSLTATAADALNATFGVTLFSEGLRIGTAATSPTVASVSEPSAAFLMLLGVGMLYFRRRAPAFQG